MKLRDVYWLAGLLEGEGCFWAGSQIHGKPSCQPRIGFGTTDRDIAGRVAHLLGVKVGNPSVKPVSKLTGIQGKDFYQVTVNGRFAIGWMMTLYSLLGTRRQEKIKDLIAKWKQHTYQNKTYYRVDHRGLI